MGKCTGAEYLYCHEDMLEGIADGTIILEGGYKVLTHDEVVKILQESM